jgi:hypothetical protein
LYDVVYLDRSQRHQVLAGGIERDRAIAIARAEARRLRVGRMFLCGSEPAPRGELVLIVESDQRRAA